MTITYLVVSGVIVFIIFRFYKDISNSYVYVSKAAAPMRTFLGPVPSAYKTILEKYFPYYRQLSMDNKGKFERKVMNFIFQKEFIPRQMTEVSLEAKVLIAASAVQLTFGLPNVYMKHFTKILLYPHDYYSSITKRFHKGEVNPRFGIIVLSWKSFVEGYIHPTDSLNVGLHEMAHALRLEVLIRDPDIAPFDPSLLQKFDAYARKICTDPTFIRNGFFRPYACTNPDEFFSVAIENFFERPQQFLEAFPELYAAMTGILLQDPLTLKASNHV